MVNTLEARSSTISWRFRSLFDWSESCFSKSGISGLQVIWLREQKIFGTQWESKSDHNNKENLKWVQEGLLLLREANVQKGTTSYSGYIDWICTSAGNNLHSSENIWACFSAIASISWISLATCSSTLEKMKIIKLAA